MAQTESKRNIIDVREIDHADRHNMIFERFEQVEPGQELEVIVGHEPAHLLQIMLLKGIPVDGKSYHSHENEDGSFSGFFRKATK